MLLYVFAKRITGSTLFATIAALLLTFDGMHFVQSRIATPEGFVVFFATLAVYAFYRFWISSQVGERAHVAVPAWGFAAGAAARARRSAPSLGRSPRRFGHSMRRRRSSSTLYVACGLYLLVRYVAFPRFFGDGAAGAYVTPKARTRCASAAGRRSLPPTAARSTRAARFSAAQISQSKGGALVYRRRSADDRIPARRERELRDARRRGHLRRRRDSRTADAAVERWAVRRSFG